MEADELDDEPAPPARKRGRPPGAKNRPKLEIGLPSLGDALDDYRHADPGAIIARQLTMLSDAQEHLRREMHAARKDLGIDYKFIERLEKLSSGILRGIDSLKRYDGLAEELQKRMSPAQLLDAAVRKVEGQDLATLNAVIKRLRFYRSKAAPAAAVAAEEKSVAEELASMEMTE